MALFAMIASVTYQHHGFFTPVLHISALFGDAKPMMDSVAHAMAGERFWLAPGAALLGLMVHMVVGAMLGMAFGLVAGRVERRLLPAAGAVFGLIAYVAAIAFGLRIAASVFGGGDPIRDMATMVGQATFAVEHVMFGMAVGVATMLLGPRAANAPASKERVAVAR